MSARKFCAILLPAVVGGVPMAAQAQLEEILVTATRRETNLQSTPLSIQAFTAEQLEIGGITNGRDLGIMVPNVVLNPSTGGAQAVFRVRGLPGVGLYVDGVWQDGFGFQQTNFTEFERVEVLRGPQGTLFGRNTNGGAVNMTTSGRPTSSARGSSSTSATTIAATRSWQSTCRSLTPSRRSSSARRSRTTASSRD